MFPTYQVLEIKELSKHWKTSTEQLPSLTELCFTQYNTGHKNPHILVPPYFESVVIHKYR